MTKTHSTGNGALLGASSQLGLDILGPGIGNVAAFGPVWGRRNTFKQRRNAMLTMNCVVVDEREGTSPARDAEQERTACRAPRILLAEDDLEMRTILASALRG